MTHERRRPVVIGGSDAGIAAGMRAHQLDRALAPLVVVADAYPNFIICGLPRYLSGETPDWRNLAHRSRDDLEGAGLQLRLEHTATHVDADNHTLDVRDPDGGTLVIGYDKLVIGTGAVPARPPSPASTSMGSTCCTPWIMCSTSTATSQRRPVGL